MITPMAKRSTIRRGVLVVLLVAATLGALYGIGRLATRQLTSGRCQVPTKSELLEQRDFVRSRLPDAADFQYATADCDDSGVGFVDFTTRIEPADATALFLADERCKPYSDQVNGEDGFSVSCVSGAFIVTIGLSEAGPDRFDGELFMERR